jgi:hypothetical protein
MKSLIAYLAQRPETAIFILPSDVERTIHELFTHPEALPQPYKIFPPDEAQQPVLGFPVADSSLIRDLDARLDRWLSEETALQVGRGGDRERTQAAFVTYIAQLMKAAENALMSNLLNDYHAVFWLAHSLDLARHFTAIPRRVSAIDVQAGRSQGDVIKYRIFAKWAGETRNQMTQLAARAAPLLDGEEQRSLQFFRILQDDVLILTEEFIGPDLRELRSFIGGYLRRDFQNFRDSFERLRSIATDLLQRERTLRAALTLIGASTEQGVTPALLLDSRFETLLFDLPQVENVLSREEREQLQLIARRIREFTVLNQLRRGITWMTTEADGSVVSTDRRHPTTFSRSTRPMDFGRPGVVDPMVHRFGMIYDISAFTETLGKLRRGGGKEEIRSYRQMLVFQRRLDSIARRHLLQFEKFLGDGAFYTTRRALRLVRAAVEIQRFYAEMRKKGFAFNQGMRVALNYGYYRLLPMKTAADASERITEFYGPGIVELSRLTTGKASKDIEELAAFLITHGYDALKVQNFFAPLAGGAGVVDSNQQSREFFAYLDGNGNLINEGIVASMPLLQELSNELAGETQAIVRIKTPYGSYLGFSPALPDFDFVGARLLGSVALKGLDKLEVGELVAFPHGTADDVTLLDMTESFAMLLRQDFHLQNEYASTRAFDKTTTERAVPNELVICLRSDSQNSNDEIVIAEWDPRSDELLHALRLPRGDFQRLFAMRDEVSRELLSEKQASVREMYQRLASEMPDLTLSLSAYRDVAGYDAWVLGDVVEKL